MQRNLQMSLEIKRIGKPFQKRINALNWKYRESRRINRIMTMENLFWMPQNFSEIVRNQRDLCKLGVGKIINQKLVIRTFLENSMNRK